MRSFESLHARARAIRSRALVRRWEMRQLGRILALVPFEGLDVGEQGVPSK